MLPAKFKCALWLSHFPNTYEEGKRQPKALWSHFFIMGPEGQHNDQVSESAGDEEDPDHTTSSTQI